MLLKDVIANYCFGDITLIQKVLWIDDFVERFTFYDYYLVICVCVLYCSMVFVSPHYRFTLYHVIKSYNLLFIRIL